MATPAAAADTRGVARAAGSPTDPFAQLGQGIWRLLTSVDFAVVQIIFLASLAAVGMTLQQLPDFAFRSPADYATAIDLFTRPEAMAAIKAEFDAYSKTHPYKSFLPENAQPPLDMNAELMKQFVPLMQRHYVEDMK